MFKYDTVHKKVRVKTSACNAMLNEDEGEMREGIYEGKVGFVNFNT